MIKIAQSAVVVINEEPSKVYERYAEFLEILNKEFISTAPMEQIRRMQKKESQDE